MKTVRTPIVGFILLMVLCIHGANAGTTIPQQDQAIHSEISEYLSSEAARVEYHWITRAAVEGVSFTRYIFVPL